MNGVAPEDAQPIIDALTEVKNLSKMDYADKLREVCSVLSSISTKKQVWDTVIHNMDAHRSLVSDSEYHDDTKVHIKCTARNDRSAYLGQFKHYPHEVYSIMGT